MRFIIRKDYLTGSDFEGTFNINFNMFRLLTGSKINLDIRHDKEIDISRRHGHLCIHDTQFIVGEKYRNDETRQVYTCVHIDNKGVAILDHMIDQIDIHTSNTPEYYMVVPE